MKKKAIIISIRPEWVEKILNGEKTIELRKTLPNCKYPIDVYIYCTKSDRYHLDWEFGKNVHDKRWFCWAKKAPYYQEHQEIYSGKVIAKFTLPYGLLLDRYDAWVITEKAKVSKEEFFEYKGTKKEIYGWKIENPIVFKKPKELSEFGLKRPPQSWHYIEITEDE